MVPSAPTRNGVAARSLPTCPTRAPRAALGTEKARRVSFQSRAAPCGPTPGLLVKSTVPVAVMCSLSPVATSIPVSTHFESAETGTSLIVGDLLLAELCQAASEPARNSRAQIYVAIERYRIGPSPIGMSLTQARRPMRRMAKTRLNGRNAALNDPNKRNNGASWGSRSRCTTYLVRRYFLEGHTTQIHRVRELRRIAGTVDGIRRVLRLHGKSPDIAIAHVDYDLAPSRGSIGLLKGDGSRLDVEWIGRSVLCEHRGRMHDGTKGHDSEQ